MQINKLKIPQKKQKRSLNFFQIIKIISSNDPFILISGLGQMPLFFSFPFFFFLIKGKSILYKTKLNALFLTYHVLLWNP